MTNLYYIRDVVSGVPESTIIQCVNDGVALRGFKKFLEGDKVVAREHELYCVAVLDDSNKVLSTEYRKLCNGSDVDSVYDDFVRNCEE